MLKAPPAVQKQLSDAVSIIGKHDFPTKWPELITEMTEKFATGISALLYLTRLLILL